MEFTAFVQHQAVLLSHESVSEAFCDQQRSRFFGIQGAKDVLTKAWAVRAKINGRVDRPSLQQCDQLCLSGLLYMQTPQDSLSRSGQAVLEKGAGPSGPLEFSLIP